MTTPTLVPAYPYYLGSGLPGVDLESGPESASVPKAVVLDGYVFGVDLTKWQSGPQDTFRDSTVQADLPNDTLFNAKGAWARYRYSWHHGTGQSLGDLDSEADAFRARTSDRVAWATKYQLTLHKTAPSFGSISNPSIIQRSADYLYWSNGTALNRTTDLAATTALTAPGGTVQAMCTDGTDLYVATSTGVVKYVGAGTAGTAFTTPVAGNCTNIAFCSGRLLVGVDNVLKEIATTGAVTTVKTHFQTAFRWTTIFNIGSRIYVGGFAGTRSELHTLTTDSSGNLVLSQEAAPLPIGEKLRTGISFAGSAVLCTSAGVRFAQVSGDGTLTYGPLVGDAGDTLCAVADGRYIFTGCGGLPGTRAGVMRFVLDDEVQALQPAYGGDVSNTAVANATVTGVGRLLGRTIYSYDNNSIRVESDTAYEGTGSTTSGQLAFGTVEPKGLISATVQFAPLAAGESVQLQIYDSNSVLVGNDSVSTLGATELELLLSGYQVRSFEAVLTLNGPGTTTPTVRSWRVRGYPIPPVVLQWLLPLIATEVGVIGAEEGVQVSRNMEDVHIWIEELYASRRYVSLRIGSRTYAVRVENFEWHPYNWDVDGDGPQGLLMVQAIAAA